MNLLQLFEMSRKKYISKFPTSPHMDSETLAYFAGKLKNHQILIEYGSGGSTIFAARMNTPFIISVESDLLFMRKVEKKLSSIKSISQVNLIHADIGKVGSWGTPLERVDGEEVYASAPWNNLEHHSLSILVLIDGRFRVTCL